MRALTLLALVACSTTKQQDPLMSSTEVSWPPVKNLCIETASQIAFHVAFDIDYTRSSMGAMKSRDLYQFTCDKSTNECDGVSLSMDAVITMMSLNRLGNASIVSSVGSTAIVQWGPLRTFTIDFDKGTVTYVESGETVEGRGVAKCSVSR